MTLTCNTIQDLLPLWADDVLHPGSREEVEAHLAPPAGRKQKLFAPRRKKHPCRPCPSRLGGNDGSSLGWHWPRCWPSAC